MRSLLVSLILLSLTIPLSMAANYIAPVIGDSMTQISTPDTNLGTSNDWYTKESPGSGYFRPYGMYNISGLPPGTIVTSAKLHARTDRHEGTFNDHVYHVYTNTWTELNITHNNQPCGVPSIGNGNCNGTASDTVSVDANNKWFQFDVTAGVRKDTGNHNTSFLIHACDGCGSSQDHDYVTKGNANQSFINITYESPTIPVEIAFYNMTSEGGAGCSNWNTNKQNACSTSDTTPTVYFVTDVDANCAIGVTNSNYSTLGASRNCTGGEGTTLHTCYLTGQDELTYENSYIYLGCKGSNNIENGTSTSGALALNITGLAQSSAGAIGVGVQNALLSSYTNYTNQQIYARNLAGLQDSGTFDWVAVKGNKTWAFNVIAKGEQHVGLFNITPVLYVLEMANVSNSTIINLVETMVNATK